MMVSTSSPGLTIFDGCFIRLDQVISETCTRPFDALLQFDERAVIGDGEHAAAHLRADRDSAPSHPATDQA